MISPHHRTHVATALPGETATFKKMSKANRHANRGVVLKRSGGRLKQDLDKDFKTI